MNCQKFDYESYAEQVGIDENNIGKSLSDNASFLAFYGYQQGKWEAVHADYDRRLETREAEVAQDIRAESAGKAPAQGVVDARVTLDEEVKRLKQRKIGAKEQVTLYSNAVKAFVDRGNNARSKNTNLRIERNSLSAGGGVAYVSDDFDDITYTDKTYRVTSDASNDRPKGSGSIKDIVNRP